MPPGKKAASGSPAPLTDADVGGLRVRVQAGETPRVIVRAASAAVPAGTRGNIIRIGNPSEGEYVVVRLGKDEVPFAPAELAMSSRGKTPEPPAPTLSKARPATTAAKPTKAPDNAPAKAGAAKGGAAKDRAKAPAKAPAKKSAGSSVKRPASRRSLPPLTVLLKFDDGEWTVEASRGARRLAKATTVRPGAVKAFADLVDDGPVREALTETVESCRTVVEERAAELRAELHAAEAALKEYDAKRR